MTEATSRGRRAIPWGAIGTLALIFAVEGELGRRAGDFRPLIAWNNAFASEAARAEAPRAKILCLGDSMMKLGVLPAVLERRLGLRSYNLGVIGAEPEMTYFLLRRALDHGARPEAIVVDFAPNLAKSDPRLFVDEKSEAIGPSEILDLVLTARDLTYVGRLAMAHWLPSIRYRNPIRSQITNNLGGRAVPEDRRGLLGRQLLRHWSANLGANALTGAGALGPGEDSPYLDPPWSVHEVNWIYIDRFFRLAESRRIPVYWLIPAFAEETQRRREFLGVDAAYGRFVDRMQARHPEVRVLDARRLGLSRSMFSDPGHLNALGASTQSLALAEALASQLMTGSAAPQRVDLALVPGREMPPVEDFQASCRIVAERAATTSRR